MQQAVEDIKTRKDTKDDESDLDDISECSAKTDATGDDPAADASYIVKSFSSFRNKKRSVFSKLASKKESLSPSKSALKRDDSGSDIGDKENTADDDFDRKSQTSDTGATFTTTTKPAQEEEKEKSDIESGVEVLEEMIFIHQTTVAGESLITMKTDPRTASNPSTPSEANPFSRSNTNLEQIMQTIKMLASQEAFMFAILACTVTLILRLSPFYQGAFLATFLMLVYKNTCDWLKQSVINKTLRSKEQPTLSRLISIHRSSVTEHKPIKSYQGWMNMIEKYKPEQYHVSDTQSVMVKLEGTTLRLCFTKTKVSKRHLWNENSKKRLVDRYSDEKVYDIQGAKVELWPRGLARKRYYSRKYPIRILFNLLTVDKDNVIETNENGTPNDFKDSFDNVSDLHRTDSQMSVKSLEMDDTISGSVSVDTLEYKDCEEDDKNVLYLFARCDREKEDWLRRLVAASLGDVFDIATEGSSANTPAESTPNKVSSKNHSPDDSPSKSARKQESEESKDTKDDEYDRLDDDAFTVFGQVISPCATRSASDFVQFITAYENKNLYDNRKTIDAEAWLDANLSKPLKPDVFWTNLVVGRILYGIIHDSSILDEIHTFLQKKLSAIKLPNFMEEVNIAEINLGNTPPLVHKIYPPSLDERGIWIDADVTYEGLISATISTKLNLMRLKKQEAGNGITTPSKDHVHRQHSRSAPVETICDSEAESTGESSSDSDEDTSSMTETENTSTAASPTTAPANKKRLLRIVNTITTSNLFQSATDIPYIQRAMENMSKNLRLRVELKGLIARVVINLPSPPSDRCWLGFRYPPRIYMSAKPTVGEKLFDWTIVTNAIENKLCDEIYKYLVYPNLIDVIMPILGQPTYRE